MRQLHRQALTISKRLPKTGSRRLLRYAWFGVVVAVLSGLEVTGFGRCELVLRSISRNVQFCGTGVAAYVLACSLGSRLLAFDIEVLGGREPAELFHKLALHSVGWRDPDDVVSCRV